VSEPHLTGQVAEVPPVPAVAAAALDLQQCVFIINSVCVGTASPSPVAEVPPVPAVAAAAVLDLQQCIFILTVCVSEPHLPRQVAGGPSGSGCCCCCVLTRIITAGKVLHYIPYAKY
jgi:hypothetical protein